MCFTEVIPLRKHRFSFSLRHDLSRWHSGESQITSVCSSVLSHRGGGMFASVLRSRDLLPVKRSRLRPILWVCLQSWRQGSLSLLSKQMKSVLISYHSYIKQSPPLFFSIYSFIIMNHMLLNNDYRRKMSVKINLYKMRGACREHTLQYKISEIICWSYWSSLNVTFNLTLTKMFCREKKCTTGDFVIKSKKLFILPSLFTQNSNS